MELSKVQNKICSKCKDEKPVSAFTKDSTRKDGFDPWCRSCKNLKGKNYRKSHAEQLKLKNKAYYIKTANQRDLYNITWAKNNPDKVRKIQRRAAKKKCSTVTGKLNNRMGTDIWETLKGNKKGKRWEDIVGYTTENLKQSLESKFSIGMTWENYGRYSWHIDHVIPKSFFIYSKPEDQEFQYCWSLGNLQPMWAKENLVKGNKIKLK